MVDWAKSDFLGSRCMEFLSLSVWTPAQSLCCLSQSTKEVDWVPSSVYTPFKEYQRFSYQRLHSERVYVSVSACLRQTKYSSMWASNQNI